MYVIELQVRAGAISTLGFANNTTHILPADRCSWSVVTDAEAATPTSSGSLGYSVNNVIFYTGHAAGVSVEGGTGATANVTRLGYIGKSGRFVPISN